MTQRRGYLWVLFAILFLSIQSIKGIPWADFWGLDFQNLYAFHHCQGIGRGVSNPYLVTGQFCGDSLKRDFYYPPLMYWSFTWTRWMGFHLAYGLWTAGGVAVLAFAAKIWAPTQWRRPWAWGFFLLVILQYPTVFALERGNNDAWVVLLWTLSFLCWKNKAHFLSGAAVALSVLFKVYPVFSALVIFAGVCSIWKNGGENGAGNGAENGAENGAGKKGRPGRKESGRIGLRFIFGGLAATSLVVLATCQETQSYFTTALPIFAKSYRPPGLANHSIVSRFREVPWVGYLICAVLLCSWVQASWRFFKKDSAIVFAGALAIGTYFSSVSEDYNLITTFPLLFLLFERGWVTQERRLALLYRGLAILGFLAVFGHRQIFVGSSVYFQLACFLGVALFLPKFVFKREVAVDA